MVINIILKEAQRKGKWKFPYSFVRQDGKEHGNSHVSYKISFFFNCMLRVWFAIASRKCYLFIFPKQSKLMTAPLYFPNPPKYLHLPVLQRKKNGNNTWYALKQTLPYCQVSALLETDDSSFFSFPINIRGAAGDSLVSLFWFVCLFVFSFSYSGTFATSSLFERYRNIGSDHTV